MAKIDMTTGLNKAKLVAIAEIYALVTCLGIVVITVSLLKWAIGRERPTVVQGVKRLCNMREREHGMSMPSGDSAAAAFLMGMYLWFFGTFWPLIIVLPLVMMARVYVFCHWFGDTIIGAAGGLMICHFFWTPHQFGWLAAPLFRAFFL